MVLVEGVGAGEQTRTITSPPMPGGPSDRRPAQRSRGYESGANDSPTPGTVMTDSIRDIDVGVSLMREVFVDPRRGAVAKCVKIWKVPASLLAA
jgi:hypothetical protein